MTDRARHAAFARLAMICAPLAAHDVFEEKGPQE